MPIPAMSLSTRLLTPLEQLTARCAGASGALYVCSTCRRQTLPSTAQHLHAHQSQVRHASNILTDELGKAVWKEDAPIPEDPYNKPSTQKKKKKLPRTMSIAPERLPEAISVEPPKSKQYKPAETWHGLRWVGGPYKPWKETPLEQDQYHRFIPSEKITNHEQLLGVVHSATVELLLLRTLQKPLETLFEVRDANALQGFVNTVKIQVPEGGDLSAATLEYDNEQHKTILQAAYAAGKGKKSKAAKQEEKPKETSAAPLAVEYTAPQDLSFLKLPLNDLSFKFNLLKRVSQRTGHRIADPSLSNLRTVASIMSYLDRASKPKPKKTADVLLADEELVSLPNVKILPKRYTPIDKEVEVGRWKIIEEELIARDLPVTGKLKQHY